MLSKSRFLLTLILILGASLCAFAKEPALQGVQPREYLDKNAKFRIWLPDGWQMVSRNVEPTVITVGFTNALEPNSPLISVGWSLMADAEGILEYYTISYLRGLSERTANFNSSEIEKIKLDGVDCIKTSADYDIIDYDLTNGSQKTDSFKSLFYFLRKYEYYFIIRATTSKDTFDKDKKLLEQIVSTFEVVD